MWFYDAQGALLLAVVDVVVVVEVVAGFLCFFGCFFPENVTSVLRRLGRKNTPSRQEGYVVIYFLVYNLPCTKFKTRAGGVKGFLPPLSVDFFVVVAEKKKNGLSVLRLRYLPHNSFPGDP